ncbi:MAG: hypothetical protein H0X02_00615 [Nitrosomonas sp.]|nr:hypothetical protein [Nitrosomonas sp.]
MHADADADKIIKSISFGTTRYKHEIMIISEDLLNYIQWPAMVVTITASWYVGAERKNNRDWGFAVSSQKSVWCIWAIP